MNDDNENDREDYVGEPGYPEYYIYSRFFADMGDWRLSWQTTFMDDVAQDEEDDLDENPKEKVDENLTTKKMLMRIQKRNLSTLI